MSPVTDARKAATNITGVKAPCSSSSTNTRPDSGALNAAPRPAPAPALISARRSPSPILTLKSSDTICPMPEPICTVGPSRPSVKPPPVLSSPPKNFTGSIRFHSGFVSRNRIDFNCGMPLPDACGANRRTSHTPTPPPTAPMASATGRPQCPVWAIAASRQRSACSSATRKADASKPASAPTKTALPTICRRFTSPALRPELSSTAGCIGLFDQPRAGWFKKEFNRNPGRGAVLLRPRPGWARPAQDSKTYHRGPAICAAWAPTARQAGSSDPAR